MKKDDEFQCPTKPKIYQLTKKLNISDWSGLDANNNGVIDFLEDDNLQKIRDYLKAIDVVGFVSDMLCSLPKYIAAMLTCLCLCRGR